MGIVDKIINNFRAKNERWKEFEEEDRVQNQLQERKLSHNERVLNKLMEEERQKRIKNQLKFMEGRRQMQEEQKARQFMKFDSQIWNDNSVLKQKNIFKKNNKCFIK